MNPTKHWIWSMVLQMVSRSCSTCKTFSLSTYFIICNLLNWSSFKGSNNWIVLCNRFLNWYSHKVIHEHRLIHPFIQIFIHVFMTLNYLHKLYSRHCNRRLDNRLFILSNVGEKITLQSLKNIRFWCKFT